MRPNRKSSISHSTDKIFALEFGEIFGGEYILFVFRFLFGDHIVAGASTSQQQFGRLLIHFERTVQLQQTPNILLGSIVCSFQFILCMFHREFVHSFNFVNFLCGFDKIGLNSGFGSFLVSFPLTFGFVFAVSCVTCQSLALRYQIHY